MTKRDAQKDIDYLKNSHKQDVLEVTVETIAMADYWIKEAESQCVRAEEAERKCNQQSISLEMIANSFEQFKKSVSLLGTQINGFTNMYSEDTEGSKPDAK